MIEMRLAACCYNCPHAEILVDKREAEDMRLQGEKITTVRCSHEPVCVKTMGQPLQAKPAEVVFPEIYGKKGVRR